MDLNSGPKNSPLCQIWPWSNNYLENNLSFLVFFTPKNVTHWKQKVAMATSDNNGYWQNMQNDRQWCKIKVRKFPFNILWRFGVMDENPGGGGGFRPPVRIGLRSQSIMDWVLLTRWLYVDWTMLDRYFSGITCKWMTEKNTKIFSSMYLIPKYHPQKKKEFQQQIIHLLD